MPIPKILRSSREGLKQMAALPSRVPLLPSRVVRTERPATPPPARPGEHAYTKAELRAGFKRSVAPFVRILEGKIRDAVNGVGTSFDLDDIRNIMGWTSGKLQLLRDLEAITPSQYNDLISTLNRMSIELHAQRGRGPRPEMALEEVTLLKVDIERL